MSIFKCKMCGGTIEFTEGATVGVCDSCGTKQTLPRAGDDITANLFNRANNLRLKCEFDKAAAIYEKIVEEDDSNAEAHWGIVLCKYGIEYVEDPKTHKRIPTCHRTLYEAVTADADYLAAVDYGDAAQQALYESEARAIDRIQKNILTIVKNEKPFDVFICYKETDENGKRTVDSAIANDIYYQLTQEGFKVFFAAITLEDKLGQEYEPYIFAALHSARVMLALGTKPEYFSAVWVKNEWSRFLSLMKTDRSKLLIPCYRDMDPYDLPEEFAHLQAQDMGKIGFINDLTRGIRKVCGAKTEAKAPVRETVVVGAAANVAPLLKRAFLFLEDGEWDEADAYCEKVLDQEPENAEAYLGKLMAELHIRRQDDIAECSDPLDRSNYYQKILRFGSESLQSKIRKDNDAIYRRAEEALRQENYQSAILAMKTAKSETDFKAAAELFEKTPDYLDSSVFATQCLEKAELCRKDGIYQYAKQAMNTTYRYATDELEQALSLFQKIPGYQDADTLVETCRKRIQEIEEEKDQQQVAYESKRTRNKKIAIAIIALLAICVIVFILVPIVFIPIVKYHAALNLYNAGEYNEAIIAFEALEDYKDSIEKIKKCKTEIENQKYSKAVDLYENGEYAEAIGLLQDCKAEEEKKVNLKKVVFSKAERNSIISFGSYEQDNNLSNGTEAIQWQILLKEGTKVLVISKQALDCRTYHIATTSTTWENCILRKWLNSTFIDNAFNKKEQEMIITSTVTAPTNPTYGTYAGNDTVDKVFLLSIDEINKWFTSVDTAASQATAYSKSNGAFTEGENNNCWWWLRSPGANSSGAAVFCNDFILMNGCPVDSRGIAVRPAMWIDLS